MKRVYLAYFGLGVVLWPLPLLNVLQVESAAVVAFVSFFVAGWSAVAHFQGGDVGLLDELIRQETALLIPLGLLTISRLWAPNCTYGEGLLFYGLFPGVTVVFALGVAYALTGMGLSRPFLALGGIGLAVSLGGPIYDLGFHPQFYTYNHVFGGILGPIYDEQLAIRPGLFWFRGMTLVWAVVAVLLGRYSRGQSSLWPIVPCIVVLAVGYLWAAPLGINTSSSVLRDALGGHVRTAHFDLYYDPKRLSDAEVAVLADDHEAQYAQVADQLNPSPADEPARIQSYLYPNPDVKARLTGARTTSVTPVWLDEPQVHLLVDRVDASLGHELAHVFSRPYGLPLLRASWAPGLVEGWAVAFEPPSPEPSPHDLVSAAIAADTVGALSGKAEAIASRLSPWGFWSRRGAVSYATMGSFVQYLVRTYGTDLLKDVYAQGNFEEVYGRSLEALARNWAASIRDRPLVARSAHEMVSRRFTRPSLFEKDCPHYVPPHRAHYQSAQRAARRGDSLAVRRHLQKSLDAAPRYVPAHIALARRRLAEGHPGAVRQQLDTLQVGQRTASIRLLQADAHVLTGAPDRAERLYRTALERTPMYAHQTRVRLFLRSLLVERPDVIRILTSDASPGEQAEALGQVDSVGGVVDVWRALRLHRAHRYQEAYGMWQQVAMPFPSTVSRAWRQRWAIQYAAWFAQTAYRAGAFGEARHRALGAADRAEALGARAWARTLRGWADRAARAEQRDPSGEPQTAAMVHGTRR